MCNVLIYDIPFGIRVFMHRDGVIREAKYRGMIVKDPGICGRNMYVEYIFWFGSKLGEGKIETSTSIYKTLEDAKREVNPIQHKILDIKSFSLRYLSCLIWDGIQFYGWLWDGSRPIKRSTRESLNACEIYRDKIAFIDYHGNKYDAEYFQRFTQTADQCRSANKPRIVMLDEEEPPYSVNPTYIRNLQEMSAEAVERLTELKCYSREEAFDIIQDWAKEFTKRYNNYVFDGSYYKMIDTFIEEKLRTI